MSDADKMAFEMWKTHITIGGDDKNWMMQTNNWLIAISASILSFSVTKDAEAIIFWLLPIAGAVVSGLAVCVAALYGGYAAGHWVIADMIAKETERLMRQQPSNWPFHPEMIKTKEKVDRDTNKTKAEKDIYNYKNINPLSRCLSRPCEGSMAPVFKIYMFVGVGFGIAHLAILYFWICTGSALTACA